MWTQVFLCLCSRTGSELVCMENRPTPIERPHSPHLPTCNVLPLQHFNTAIIFTPLRPNTQPSADWVLIKTTRMIITPPPTQALTVEGEAVVSVLAVDTF